MVAKRPLHGYMHANYARGDIYACSREKGTYDGPY